jgi:hypothetical protein
MTYTWYLSDLDKPALACPVLDTEYLIRDGNDSFHVIDRIGKRNYIGLHERSEHSFMRMKRKQFLWLLSIILSFHFLFGCDRPKMTGLATDEIDTSRDPIQTSHKSDEPIIKEIKNGHFTITPVAEYRISGMVVGKETYSSGWDGEISPVDLAIVWGKLVEPEYDRYITYIQRSRWYFYQYKSGTPFDNSLVISHSANNHIIPASENIRKAVKRIKEKDKVVLEGFLVNIKGTYKGQPVTWNTSLSRTDTGSASCELFYVCKVRINTKVYE